MEVVKCYLAHISEPSHSFLQTIVYICVFTSLTVLVLVAAYFAVRKYKKNKCERGSGWPYQIVGSNEGKGPHLLDPDDDGDEDEDAEK